jgi:hypothetical protein
MTTSLLSHLTDSAQRNLIQTQAKAESSQMKEKIIAKIKEKFSLKGTKNSSNS